MKHVTIAILTYMLAVCETAAPEFPAQPMWLWGLATFVVVTSSCEAGVVWAALLGLISDAIGNELLGTQLLSLVAAAALVRAVIPRLPERSLHVVCLAGLVFLSTAAGCRLLITNVNHQLTPPVWLDLVTTLGITWLCVVAFATSLRVSRWLADRFRRPSDKGGAMGTPVGLTVN